MKNTRAGRRLENPAAGRKIRLGIWGLCRGRSFEQSCRELNIEVVAGCDFDERARSRFAAANPEAFVGDNAEEFLKQDFDAVLLATYCPEHAAHAVACLEAGKHVLSEVTSFHTMAEGVRLVEAAEKSGLVYNLAENYPFSASNMWLKRRWDEGLFGELMYAEYEYVHELLVLAYTTLGCEPLVPGHHVHGWRSWIHYHYYNTHSLGPMMYITGLRPTRVVSLPGEPRVPGTLVKGHNGTLGIAPSLINMSNGAVVRNLMGSMPSDTHSQRIWGTLGAAQIGANGLELRLGGRGRSLMLRVHPKWEEMADLAAKTGHGGGDFWVLYYFARQIREGIPAPFDLYNACDCTIPGILAFKSQDRNGTPYDVPDFRDPAQREPHRNDDFAQARYDTKNGLFPPDADKDEISVFSTLIRDFIALSTPYREVKDWMKVVDAAADPRPLLPRMEAVIQNLPKLIQAQQAARRIRERYPESDAARVLGEMLEFTDADSLRSVAYRRGLKADIRKATARIASFAAETANKEMSESGLSPFIGIWQTRPGDSRVKTIDGARPVALTGSWKPLYAAGGRVIAPGSDSPQPALAYVGNKFSIEKKGVWNIMLGHDCALKLFVDGVEALSADAPEGGFGPDIVSHKLKLRKGRHDILLALIAGGNRGAFSMRFKPVKPRARFPVGI